ETRRWGERGKLITSECSLFLLFLNWCVTVISHYSVKLDNYRNRHSTLQLPIRNYQLPIPTFDL
ncbi:MAG: hypothetical protein AAGM40_30550, partial [Cyanobacteria bacterium J06573_2]